MLVGGSGDGVKVGGTGVGVGGTDVSEGGTRVLVGGRGVGVEVDSTCCPTTKVGSALSALLTSLTMTSAAMVSAAANAAHGSHLGNGVSLPGSCCDKSNPHSSCYFRYPFGKNSGNYNPRVY